MTLLRNSYGPDPESDNGVHVMNFAFEPHGRRIAAGELIRRGMAFNRPPVAVTSRARPKALPMGLALDAPESVVCTALRRAEHSAGLLARFFEADGKPAKIRFGLDGGIRSAREVNFLENPVGRRVRVMRGTVSAALRPYEVKTFLVETGE
jgi:alpha-mannosidase